jgi:hypothetical protein
MREQMTVKRNAITTTIKRQWLAEIVAGTKRIEYRELKDYWSLNGVKVPFELRLINGMNRPIPEVTVLIGKVTIDRREKVYELHIKKVIGFKHWEKDRQKPKR